MADEWLGLALGLEFGLGLGLLLGFGLGLGLLLGGWLFTLRETYYELNC